MKKRVQTLIIASLAMNIMFLTLAGIFVQRRGGLSYLVNTFSRIVNNQAEKQSYYSPIQSMRYLERTSMFKLSTIKPEMVFLGDSLIERLEWMELFPCQKVINRGIGGDTTAGILNRLDNLRQVTSSSCEIFLYVGINDLMVEIPEKTIIRNYKEIIKIIKKMPHQKIYVQGLLPLNSVLFQRYHSSQISNVTIKKFNNKLEDLALEMQVDFIDLYPYFVNISADELPEDFTFDGLHLSGNGYERWIKIINNR